MVKSLSATSGTTFSPYFSAELNHKKIPTFSIGAEINRGNTNAWAEAYRGGTGVDAFTGVSLGAQQTVLEKGNNSIYTGGQVGFEQGNQYQNSKAMATVGYSRELNDRTSAYVQGSFGVQNYKEPTVTTNQPAYEATVGVERNFGNTTGRLESFVENFPTVENGKKSTEPYAGLRLSILF